MTPETNFSGFSWNCYTGYLRVGSKPWQDMPPTVWILGVSCGGASKMVQSQAYMCADRLLNKDEADALTNAIREKYLTGPGAVERERQVTPSLAACDFVRPIHQKNTPENHRISVYTSELEPGKYQLFIEFFHDYPN